MNLNYCFSVTLYIIMQILLWVRLYVSCLGQSDTLFYSSEKLQQYFRYAAGDESAVILLSKKDLISDLKKACPLRLEQEKGGPPLWNEFDPHHVISIRPHSTNQFYEILHAITGHLYKLRYRVWRPPIVFYWPIKLAEPSENWRDFIRHSILNKVISVADGLFDVNQNVYFHFEVDSVHNRMEEKERNNESAGNSGGSEIQRITRRSSEYQSVWEVYFINGYVDRVSVAEEVNGSTVEIWDRERITRRTNLRNVTLSVVAPKFTNTKYQLKWETINGTEDLTGGISLDIMRDFAFRMNFSWKVRDGDWITQLENGTLNGTTADLLSNRQLDLMIGQSVPILQRTTVLEYLQPTSENTLRAYVHQPPASAFNDIFINPFQLRLRFALLVGLCLVLLSIRFTSWILHRYTQVIKPEDAGFNHDVGIWLVGAISQQGWYRPPTCTALRCAFLTTVGIALVCYVAYSAEIVSSLSAEPVPIQNLTDLFQSSLPIYAVEDSLTLQEIVRRLGSQVKSKIVNVSLNVGIFLIFNGPSSLVSYTHRFHDERKQKNISNLVACNLYAFPLTAAPLPACMGVLKHSPFREYFNHRIISMKEQGLLDRYRQRMNVISGLHCTSDLSTSYRAHLGLNDVSTAVIILTSGYFLGLTVVLCETVYYYRMARCKKGQHNLEFQYIE